MIRSAFEFIGDVCNAIWIFAGYMLTLAGWSWLLIFAFIPSAHAGNHCATCYAPYQQVVATPTTIIEHQNVEQFFQVPNYVQQYAVTPNAVVAANLGQAQRAAALAQDRLAEMQQMYAQQQPAPVQLVYAVPVQAAAACVQQTMPAPANATQATASQPVAKPDGIVEHKCFECHSGANPKGKFALDKPLDCKKAMLAIAKVTSNEMPYKRTPLTDAEKVQLSAELLNVTQPEQSAPAPAEAE